MKEKKLTAKEAKFVQEFLIDSDASKAARRAGYSAKTAGQIGFYNLKKLKIQEALTAARIAVTVATGVTPERITQARANIAFFDLAECYTPEGVLKNIHDIPKEARLALAGLEADEIFVGSGDARVSIGYTKKIKAWDKNRALEALEKQFGMYDADKSGQANYKFIICGTPGQSLEETIKDVGSVEIVSE